MKYLIETDDKIVKGYVGLIKGFSMTVDADSEDEAASDFARSVQDANDYVGDDGIFNFTVTINGKQFNIEASAVHCDVEPL